MTGPNIGRKVLEWTRGTGRNACLEGGGRFVRIREVLDRSLPSARYGDLLLLNGRLPLVKFVLGGRGEVNLVCDYPGEAITETTLEVLLGAFGRALQAYAGVRTGRCLRPLNHRCLPPVWAEAAQEVLSLLDGDTWVVCEAEEGFDIRPVGDPSARAVHLSVELDVVLRLLVVPEFPAHRHAEEALCTWLLMVGDRIHLVQGVQSEKGALGFGLRLTPAVVGDVILRDALDALWAAGSSLEEECEALCNPQGATAFLRAIGSTFPDRKEG